MCITHVREVTFRSHLTILFVRICEHALFRSCRPLARVAESYSKVCWWKSERKERENLDAREREREKESKRERERENGPAWEKGGRRNRERQIR